MKLQRSIGALHCERANVMGSISVISPAVRAYLVQLPLYAVWLVGIILCMKRWERHPGVSLVAMIAFSLLFFESLVGTLVSYSLPSILAEREGMNSADIGPILHLVWFGLTLVHAGLWGVVIAAIFGWRNESRHRDMT